MSRWLDLLDKGDFKLNTVSTRCRKVQKAPLSQPKGEIAVLISNLKVKAANLEARQGMTSGAAKWATALDAFVLPDEREHFFEGGQLRPRYHQVTFATESGLVVTFHHDKKITFYKPKSSISEAANE